VPSDAATAYPATDGRLRPRSAEQGVIVVIADFSAEAAERTISDLRQTGPKGEMTRTTLVTSSAARSAPAAACTLLAMPYCPLTRICGFNKG